MPITSPNACAYGSLAYYSGTSSLVLVNTSSYGAMQTWQWKSGNWSQTTGTQPTTRTNCGLASDGTNLVLFAGRGLPGSNLCNDVWLLNSSSVWSNPIANYNSLGLVNNTITTSLDTMTYPNTVVQTGFGTTGLTIRESPYMATMTAGVFTYGGLDAYQTMRQDLYLWTNGSQTWTVQNPVNVPSIRAKAACASNGTNNMLLFGGANESFMLNDLNSFNGTNWTSLTTNAGPSCRVGASMAWSPALSAFVLFGGSDSSGRCLADSWQLTVSGSTGTWTQLTLTNNPTACEGSMMAYDTASSQLILFGGKTNAGLLNNTYVLTNTTTGWTQL